MAETAEPACTPEAAAPDDTFWVGVAHWRQGRYLDAVEVFEELWAGEVGERRRFLQGVIHATMGCYYLTRQDWPSAESKLASAARLLAEVGDEVPGVDGHGLRAAIAAARVALGRRSAGGEPPARIPAPRLVRDGALPEDDDGH
jgi:predicted metal-dependent hydrolase